VWTPRGVPSFWGAVCCITITLWAGCASDYRQEMDDGFPAGLGVDSEANLRDALGRYQMDPGDAECVARAAFTPAPGPDGTGGSTYYFSTEELNAACS
jgi:hypothetical protein